MELSPDQKGAVAESAIVHAAIKLGVGVYKPLSDGERCDLIFNIGGNLLRVQCKWARRLGETLVVNCRSSRRCLNGYVRRVYTSDEVDAIAAYSLDLDRCYFLPPHAFDGRLRSSSVLLRRGTTRERELIGPKNSNSKLESWNCFA